MDPRTEEYLAVARDRLSVEVWDFIEGGAGAELSLNANRRIFDELMLRPRVLVDVSRVSPATTLLGEALAAPIGVAPIAYHRLVHPDGELATARGAGTAGALLVVSIFASQSMEDIAAHADGPLWLQIYWLHERATVVSLVERAQLAGYRAIVLTVDAPRLGRRLRDLRHGFAIAPDIRAANLDPEFMVATHLRQVGSSAVAEHAAQAFDASITWDDLPWLRSVTDLPLVLKGILTGDDAKFAVDHGVNAIIVSNHGGRQLDGAVPSLRALPEVVAAVNGACPVLLDGNIRTGRDVFLALALGADAVLVGRPVMWALAAEGAEGVAQLLTDLTADLAHTMALAGRPTIADIDRDAVFA